MAASSVSPSHDVASRLSDEIQDVVVGDQRSRDAVRWDIGALGRNEMPVRLYLAWRGGEIDVPTLREWIPFVWSVAEWPAYLLGHSRWLELFNAAGFVSDGWDEPLDDPLTVYRGAALSASRGFSWTWEFERAELFAHRTTVMGLEAAVYEVTLPRHMLLAVIGGVEGRGEREVVVNPRRLRGRYSPREVLHGGGEQ